MLNPSFPNFCLIIVLSFSWSHFNFKAYAKFWSDQQRVLWYVMVFSVVVNYRTISTHPTPFIVNLDHNFHKGIKTFISSNFTSIKLRYSVEKRKKKWIQPELNSI